MKIILENVQFETLSKETLANLISDIAEELEYVREHKKHLHFWENWIDDEGVFKRYSASFDDY